MPLELLHDLFVHWAGFCGGEDVDPPARNLTEEDLLAEPGLRGIPPINWTAVQLATVRVSTTDESHLIRLLIRNINTAIMMCA